MNRLDQTWQSLGTSARQARQDARQDTLTRILALVILLALLSAAAAKVFAQERIWSVPPMRGMPAEFPGILPGDQNPMPKDMIFELWVTTFILHRWTWYWR